ncbi:MAG TPA: Gfo/Idh/MocA family oxidoreductase, partial [Thermomicrobiales bacterium]|nr:Gfo/Idh/MocA family oxidoreductase [Thermomicrobiales bacterium]
MIGLGVVGCGDVAMRTYLPGFAAIAERARVVACFDPDAGRAARFAASAADVGSPDVATFGDLAAFLAHPGLEAVFDLAPAPFHAATNQAILDAGKHCFSEKPLAGSVAVGRALTDLARARDLVFLVAPAVMATNRFEWLKRESAAGRFGRLTLATGQMANMGPAAWREYNGDPTVFYGPEVGPLLDTGVYVLHAMTGLLGPARRVEAFGGVAIPERRILIPARYGEAVTVTANDHMLVHLDFGDATFAQLLSSFATPRSKAPAFELHGENGTVSIPMQNWYDLYTPVDIWMRDERRDAREVWEEAMPPEPSPVDHLIQAGPLHFVDCIERRIAPILTGEQATHVLDIILSAAR